MCGEEVEEGCVEGEGSVGGGEGRVGGGEGDGKGDLECWGEGSVVGELSMLGNESWPESVPTPPGSNIAVPTNTTPENKNICYKLKLKNFVEKNRFRICFGPCYPKGTQKVSLKKII